MINEARYLGLSRRLLRFQNSPGSYPVNEYQSLVLASAAEIGAMTIAVRQHRPMESLSAWEPCCGGGPAALALKGLGLHYVQATDLNEAALEACRRNARLNALTLDRVELASLLEDGTQRNFDLICCNPPCGVESVIGESVMGAKRLAVDGGVDGMDFSIELVQQAAKRLVPEGSLIMVVVSTGNVRRLAGELSQVFGRSWRVISPTPIAAPWAKANDALLERMKQGVEFERFVWTRPDGWLWRLTWVIEASLGLQLALNGGEAEAPGFPLRPFGLDVKCDEDLLRKIDRMGRDSFWLSTSFQLRR
jgi:methylase of polypeptide subunit release factors